MGGLNPFKKPKAPKAPAAPPSPPVVDPGAPPGSAGNEDPNGAVTAAMDNARRQFRRRGYESTFVNGAAGFKQGSATVRTLSGF